MNSSAIYSKSGKGVQEASGKSSLLKRGERAVLSAIDGRATLAEVAQKVGQQFDAEFVQLIRQLDKDGFIREVSAGAPGAAPRPAATRPPAAKAPAPAEAISDLDFTVGIAPRSSAPPPPPQPVTVPPPPPKRPAAPTPPPMSAVEKARAAAQAKEQQASLAKAREEAERKAQEDRERLKAEAEAKVRAETEAKLRTETEKKLAFEAEDRKKAAAEAAARAVAEAKAKAKAEAERARREAEELRERLEGKAKEQAERIRREAEEKARHEAEELRQRLEEERRAREQAERRAAEAPPPAASASPSKTGRFHDLLADLDAFTRREEADRKAKADSERQEKEEKSRKKREAAERKAEEERAEAERRERDMAERKQRAAEERRAREEEERRLQEEEQHRPPEDDIPVTDDDLGMDEVQRDQRALSKEARAAVAERERQSRVVTAPVAATRPRRRRKLWRPVALTLAVLLAVGIAGLHFWPLSTAAYERALAQALGRPVRIASAHLSLITGVQLRFDGVSIGEAKIAAVRAHPSLMSLHDERKKFSRVELDGVLLPQQALGELLGARVRSESFSLSRLSARQVKLAGPLPLPLIDAEVALRQDGSLAVVTLSGPQNLMARVFPRGAQVEFDMTASSFALPIAPEVQLSSFAMKGSATRQGMNIESWGGALYDGAISGTAKIRWGGNWSVDGVLAVRNLNAAVFAPALLSAGKAEGNGRFLLSGADPVRLGATGRVEGSFSISKGVLGAFDLSRAIQTGGRQAGGRTQFTELTGQGVFERGAVALRNVNIGAGALNAGASADIAQSGALSGRIIADVRAANQTLRATLNLGGTLKEPQVRN